MKQRHCGALAPRIVGWAWVLLVPALAAGEEGPRLVRCAAIEDEAARLRCYDELAEDRVEPPVTEPVPGDPPTERPSPLAVRWEIEPQDEQGTFMFRPHRQNYLLPLRYSNSPNDEPDSPRLGPVEAQELDNTETKFQLSFKIRARQGLFNDRADLWFAYTQQSSWQVYNAALSRPFRETNYEPEIMLVFPTDFRLWGLRGRFVNVGVVHQSNGRSEPLSRSWNRVYVQLGFERGNLALLVRPWYRIPEDEMDDDNEDIDDFLGYGDVLAVYKLKQHTFSLLLRNNLDSPNRGAAQLDWSFPGHGRLKGYLQLFTGYGESLIDYNHSQTTVALGLLLTDLI